jgi:hypothetical protein
LLGNHKSVLVPLARLLLGVFLTLLLTYFSLAIADNVGTPQFVRYVFSSGYVLGIHFASGTTFGETLSSFLRISLTVNVAYYGLIMWLLLIRKINWQSWREIPAIISGWNHSALVI